MRILDSIDAGSGPGAGCRQPSTGSGLWFWARCRDSLSETVLGSGVDVTSPALALMLGSAGSDAGPGAGSGAGFWAW